MHYTGLITSLRSLSVRPPSVIPLDETGCHTSAQHLSYTELLLDNLIAARASGGSHFVSILLTDASSCVAAGHPSCVTAIRRVHLVRFKS